MKVVAAIAALAGGLALAGSAAAGAVAHRAAAPPAVEIGVGDTLRVVGSRVACVVAANGAKTGVLCLLLTSISAPVPGSYAVGLAEDGEAILVGYDKRGQGVLVTRFTQARARAARIIGARHRCPLRRRYVAAPRRDHLLHGGA